MGSINYKIILKTSSGIITAKYKSQNKLEIGEEIFLVYNKKTNLVKITGIKKGFTDTIEAQEISA